ncbi:MAG: hypothetical protein VXZ39_04280, partial [Planctomycetota bacterium]|nr:hypothetical protein [Planctomycetota bacterium]
MDRARRDLESRSSVGGRKISPKDVLDRYDGDRKKTGATPKTGQRPGSSSPGARPMAPGAGRGVKTTGAKPIGITDVRGGSSGKRPQQTGGPTKVDPTGAKPGKGSPITVRPDKGSPPGKPDSEGPGGRPMAPGTKDGRPGGGKARPAGFTKRLNTAVGAPRPGSGANTAPPGSVRPDAITHV